MKEPAVLAAVELTKFQPRDLGDRIRFVGGLERAREERILLDRLGSELRIDAGAAEKEDPLHPGLIGRLNQIRGDHEIVVEEVGRVGVVGVDSSDFRGGDEDDIGTVFRHKLTGGALVAQVEFGARRGELVFTTGRGEGATEGTADHTSMAGDVVFFIGGGTVHEDFSGSAFEPAHDHGKKIAAALLPFLEGLNTGENCGGTAALLVSFGGPGELEHFLEASVTVLETRLEAVLEKVGDDARDIEVGLEMFATVRGDGLRSHRTEALEQGQALARAPLADPELADDIVHGQRIG